MKLAYAYRIAADSNQELLESRGSRLAFITSVAVIEIICLVALFIANP